MEEASKSKADHVPTYDVIRGHRTQVSCYLFVHVCMSRTHRRQKLKCEGVGWDKSAIISPL